jgi:hypothetical protein
MLEHGGGTRNPWRHNLVQGGVTKKEGEMISGLEILDVGYTYSIGIVEIFLKQKEDYYKYCFYIHILTNTKFYYLSFMDLKGSNFSWFPLKELVGCLMRVATHTSTTKIPQVQSQHHHMVPFRNWIETQNRVGECDFIHFIVSPCSQNPWSSHYPVSIFLLELTHYTFTLRPPNCQMMLPQQPILKTLTHSSFPFCWSLKRKCSTS